MKGDSQAAGSPSLGLFELKAEISHGAADAVDNVLLELGVGGWSLLEDDIGRRAWIVGIFASEAEVWTRWRELLPLLSAPPFSEPSVRALSETDWRDSYKAHFHAWTFGRLHWVPIWERGLFQLPEGHEVLWLDPGLAFGTGNHETTRLCIESLVALEDGFRDRGVPREGLRVIDAGCGSGILALSAALLGFGLVDGFDNDPEAVRASLENAGLNHLGDRVRFRLADLAEGLDDFEADILLANIQSDVLTRHAATLLGAICPGGSLILSGILASELPQVRDAFVALAPHWPPHLRVDGEWGTLSLKRR